MSKKLPPALAAALHGAESLRERELQGVDARVRRPLVLSLFPGIGLLDMAFEAEGFCVVRGPDVLWGGDIRRFQPPAGVFDGVIGGPPCKPFLNIQNLNRYLGRVPKHPNLIPEYERCIEEAQPRWFLMENVPQAPVPQPRGYWPARNLHVDNRWLGEKQRRRRRFSFGTHFGGIATALDISPDLTLFDNPEFEYAVAGKGAISWMKYDKDHKWRPSATVLARKEAMKRPYGYLCELQGLPPDFLEWAPFTAAGKIAAIAQGVPLPMGRAIARAVKRAIGADKCNFHSATGDHPCGLPGGHDGQHLCARGRHVNGWEHEPYKDGVLVPS